MILLALAALPLVQGDVWAQRWTELERLHEADVPAAEVEPLRAHLSDALHSGASDARSELLRAELERLAGRDPAAAAAALASLDPDPFTPREDWFLAECLPGGPLRARRVVLALQAPADLTRWQLFLAYNTGVAEARELRMESALAVQQKLHERYRAEWSALDLSLTLNALGKVAEAEAVLVDTIEREVAAARRPKALWEQRGILALGSGDERKARDYLGRAMALGSDDAGLLLARLDLMAGDAAAARAGFRALILNAPPPDRAWRGWGMATLPAPHSPPAKKTPPDADP